MIIEMILTNYKKIITLIIVIVLVNISIKSVDRGINNFYEKAGVKFDIEKNVVDKTK